VVQLCEEASYNVTKSIAPINSNVELLESMIAVAAETVFADMPRVKMRDIGEYVLRGVEIEAGKRYSQITVGMKHRGLRLRRICDGSEIKSPGQSSVEEDDILFSRIDIRQGAIGFVDRSLQGGVVTRDFPVFRLKDTSEVNRQFMRFAFMAPSFAGQAREASRGTTGRKKMKRSAFLAFEIPRVTPERQAVAVKVLTEVERNSAKLVAAYRKQELLAKALGMSVIGTLYAKDAGLI
jgi:type I restriction enzyme S subunit